MCAILPMMLTPSVFLFSSAGIYDCLILFLNGLLEIIFREKYLCELGITVKGFFPWLEDDAVFPTVMIP